MGLIGLGFWFWVMYIKEFFVLFGDVIIYVFLCVVFVLGVFWGWMCCLIVLFRVLVRVYCVMCKVSGRSSVFFDVVVELCVWEILVFGKFIGCIDCVREFFN